MLHLNYGIFFLICYMKYKVRKSFYCKVPILFDIAIEVVANRGITSMLRRWYICIFITCNLGYTFRPKCLRYLHPLVSLISMCWWFFKWCKSELEYLVLVLEYHFLSTRTLRHSENTRTHKVVYSVLVRKSNRVHEYFAYGKASCRSALKCQ